MSVGGPNYTKLQAWGRMLKEVFGEMPYLVGSSTTSKQFRDVDVVVMMSNEKFFLWAGPHGKRGVRWQALCASFSAWGKEITGLNIDFKIQQVLDANKQHKGTRMAIGIEIDDSWRDPDCPEFLKFDFKSASDEVFDHPQEPSE